MTDLALVRDYNPASGVQARIASEAMTAYKFVKINATHSDKVDLCDTAGEQMFGVVDQVWEADDNANVFYAGVVPLTAGAAVTAGQRVSADASARAIPTTSAHEWTGGIALTAASAAGDIISVLIQIQPFDEAAMFNYGLKVFKANVTAPQAEENTTILLPTKCAVIDAWLDVNTAEATGAAKTLDVGTVTASNDPDGFLDGVSVAATGVVKAGATFTTGSNEVYFASSTYGDLLAPVQIAGSDAVEDTGTYLEAKNDITSGGSLVSVTPGSGADFVELDVDVYILAIEFE